MDVAAPPSPAPLTTREQSVDLYRTVSKRIGTRILGLLERMDDCETASDIVDFAKAVHYLCSSMKSLEQGASIAVDPDEVDDATQPIKSAETAITEALNRLNRTRSGSKGT